MADESLHRRLRELVRELVERGLPLKQARSEFERQYLIAALRHHEGSLNRSAAHLGVHRNTLHNRMDQHAIKPAEYRSRSPKGS